MHSRVFSSLARGFLLSFVWIPTAASAAAQSSAAVPTQPVTPAPNVSAQHDMQHMQMGANQMFMPPAREGSGTSWLPDESPMYAVHRQAGSWTLMSHGNGFLQYLHESGDRGADQVGSINWIMGMADRTIGDGHLGLRAMVSLEPLTIRGCGYPDLLASGEVCKGEAIHDRQHPHDLFMELAATYDRPLTANLRWQVYGGPVGEPALGPTAFPHRISAMVSPLAPITHHWLDATHITFGVITGGIYGDRWKAEGSVFNGREPDEHRADFDFGALDSWSGRAWFLPTARWALQMSAGHLTEAEAGHDGGRRIDVDRFTASATYHRKVDATGIWATTVGWGRNKEPEASGTNALMAETNLTLGERDAWFGRFEWAQKSGDDLDLESHDDFAVAKFEGGYTRYLNAWNGLKPGAGIGLSAGVVPQSLVASYGRRLNVGVAVYLTLRPSDMAASK